MSTLLGVLIGMVIIGLASGLIIWLVSRLGLGLQVDGPGSAVLAALVIAVLGGALSWLLSLIGVQDGDGLIGGIIHLLATAVVLLVGGRLLPGLTVNGFGGALVAAVAIGAFYWLGGLLLGQLV